MSPLLALAIAAAAIGLTIRSARRGLGDRHTVEAHHRALDTLASMAAHPGSAPPLRPAPTGVGRHRSAPTGLAPTGPGPSRDGPGAPGDLRAAPLAPPMPAAALVARTAGVSGSGRAVPRTTPGHRRRAVPAPFVRGVAAVVVAALALAVVVAVVVGRRPGAPAQRPGPSAAAPARTTPATSPAPAPAPAPVVLLSADSQEAHFRVARSRADIVLVPVSACWVQVRTGAATGPVVFTATLHQGDRHPLPSGQPVWVRIGNPPGLSVEVNGTPLRFSAPSASQPFNLIFEPTG